MSSVLAAFAKTQVDAVAAPLEVDEENGYTSDHSDAAAVSNLPAMAKPTTLAAFARASQPQEGEQQKTTITLVDIAKASQPVQPSLVDVARAHDQQQQKEVVSSQLSAIASQVNAEEHEAAECRSKKIDHVITATSKQVQQEHAAKRHSIVTKALQQAAKAEAAYNQNDDEFEQEDPVAERATVLVVAAAKNKDVRSSKSLSVDRHVLKQRQQSHGLQSKSTTKAQTMKDKLSSFQFQQLSITQQRVFRAMLIGNAPDPSSRKKKKCNMHAIEELAKDRETQRLQKQKLLKLQPPAYAKLDDVRHCRFRPILRSTDAGGGGRGRDNDDDDDDGDNQKTDDFVRRMEATERVRVEQLRRTRAEREYNARVDKKECPQCGNPQSYAELMQKRKKCPNCGVSYKSRLAWSEIADAFLARMAAHVASTSDNQQQNEPSHRKTTTNKPTWAAVRDEFLGRLQLDLQQRELSKALILQALEAQCTFTPQISERAKRLRLGDFDERLRRDLEVRRLRQEQYRLLSAAVARTEAYASTSSAKRLPPGFARRLQQDLQQRREREAMHQPPRKLYPGRQVFG